MAHIPRSISTSLCFNNSSKNFFFLNAELTKLDPSHVIYLRTKVQAAKDVNDCKGCPESKGTVNLE